MSVTAHYVSNPVACRNRKRIVVQGIVSSLAGQGNYVHNT